MLESGAIQEFPLCDEEVLLRHLQTTARRYVAEHESGKPGTPVQISAAS